MAEYIVLAVVLIIFTYISIKDWKTGFISILLNFIILGLSIAYTILVKTTLISNLIKLAIFVAPFILTELIYQLFFNKAKDEEKFLIGGGDIILFASISLILSTFGMMMMFFFACLASLVVAGIIKERRVPFAPFLEFGMIIAILFADKISILLNSLY